MTKFHILRNGCRCPECSVQRKLHACWTVRKTSNTGRFWPRFTPPPCAAKNCNSSRSVTSTVSACYYMCVTERVRFRGTLHFLLLCSSGCASTFAPAGQSSGFSHPSGIRLRLSMSGPFVTCSVKQRSAPASNVACIRIYFGMLVPPTCWMQARTCAPSR